jgi:hypothetical protein
MKLRSSASASHALPNPRPRRVVEAVDHALATLPRRSCLTHQEATLAVSEVMVAVADSSDSRDASDALDRAVTVSEPTALVDRIALVDALLDVRLAMNH